MSGRSAAGKELLEYARGAKEEVAQRWRLTKTDSIPECSSLAALPLTNRPDGDGRTVGLCIASKNRTWAVQKALSLNLVHNWGCRRWAKFFLVDLGSTDQADLEIVEMSGYTCIANLIQ